MLVGGACGASVGGGAVSVGGGGVSVGAPASGGVVLSGKGEDVAVTITGVFVASGVGVYVAVGVGVSVGMGVCVGVAVMVKVGLGVLDGVGVTRDELLRLREQPNSSRANRPISKVRNTTRFLTGWHPSRVYESVDQSCSADLQYGSATDLTVFESLEDDVGLGQ